MKRFPRDIQKLIPKEFSPGSAVWQRAYRIVIKHNTSYEKAKELEKKQILKSFEERYPEPKE